MLWLPSSRVFLVGVVFFCTSLWLSYDFLISVGEESSDVQGPGFSLGNVMQEALTQEQSKGHRQLQFSLLKSALSNNFLIWPKTECVKLARFLV